MGFTSIVFIPSTHPIHPYTHASIHPMHPYILCIHTPYTSIHPMHPYILCIHTSNTSTYPIHPYIPCIYGCIFTSIAFILTFDLHLRYGSLGSASCTLEGGCRGGEGVGGWYVVILSVRLWDCHIG